MRFQACGGYDNSRKERGLTGIVSIVQIRWTSTPANILIVRDFGCRIWATSCILGDVLANEIKMGKIKADIVLTNPREPQLKPFEVEALVDTGAMTICIPEHVAVQLQLEEIEKREVTTADDRSHVVPYVGPIQVKFENRTCFTGALVIGDSVLLGAVPMEDMVLVISPSRRTITVNPNSPNLPSALVK